MMAGKRTFQVGDRSWKVRVKWEPRDVWLGLYWTRPSEYAGTPPHLRGRQWFICLLPCLPIIVSRVEKVR